MDWAVLVTGYSVERLSELIVNALSDANFRRQGTADYVAGIYRMHHSLTRQEATASVKTVGAARSASGPNAQSQ
jgi:hypothetical protein